jgi:hypothetical protein
MGRGAWLRLSALVLTGSVSAGCTAAVPHQSHQPAPVRPTTGASASGPIGSPGHPLSLGCAEQAISAGPAQLPGGNDLVIGPLDIVNGRLLPTASPAGWGDNGSYKIPVAVAPYGTVTVVIAARARGYVAIDNPYGPPGGVAAATYHSCQGAWTVFAQGFVFRGGRIRGCVPLDVQVAGQPQAHQVTLSLFAGSCPA